MINNVSLYYKIKLAPLNYDIFTVKQWKPQTETASNPQINMWGQRISFVSKTYFGKTTDQEGIEPPSKYVSSTYFISFKKIFFCKQRDAIWGAKLRERPWRIRYHLGLPPLSHLYNKRAWFRQIRKIGRLSVLAITWHANGSRAEHIRVKFLSLVLWKTYQGNNT
jgi:hypothetical protein